MSIIVPDRSLEAPIDPRPFPLDERIRNGLEIYDGLNRGDLAVVADRFEQVLADMRADETKEYGACLAFAVRGLSKRQQEELEMTLVETGQRQNHGLVQHEIIEPKPTLFERFRKRGEDKNALWAGTEGTAKFTLYRNVGFIVLSDGTAPRGTVWSLHGTNRSLG